MRWKAPIRVTTVFAYLTLHKYALAQHAEGALIWEWQLHASTLPQNSGNNAFTKASALNGCKSSTVSPTPVQAGMEEHMFAR